MMTWSLALDILKVFLSSTIGTLGFAIILHVPKRAWLPASVMGGLAYAAYWVLAQFFISDPAANFVGALIGSLMAQYCARRMLMLATLFLMLSIIPVVPGLGLYRCMHYLAQSMYNAGAAEGVKAMVVIVMIALGLGVGSFIFRTGDVIKRQVKKAGGAK